MKIYAPKISSFLWQLIDGLSCYLNLSRDHITLFSHLYKGNAFLRVCKELVLYKSRQMVFSHPIYNI